MARKPIYTFVNRPDELTQAMERAEQSIAKKLAASSEESVSRYRSLPDALKKSLSTTVAPVLAKSPRRRSEGIASGVEKLVQKLGSQDRVATIGLLDLGAWVTGLPALIELLNSVQSRFVFLEVQTPVPAGMVKTKANLVAWAEGHGVRLTRGDKADLTRNMLADEFFYFGESVLKSLGFDYLIGLTPAMIAFLEKDTPHWNYYAVGHGQVAVVSTCDLREFSKAAGRSYEAAIGMLIIGELLAIRNTKLTYHKDGRGCVFDFNEVREELAMSIRAMRIEDSCLKKIRDLNERQSAEAMITALAKMKGVRHG